MINAMEYLNQAAFVEALGCPIKVDNVAATLTWKAETLGSRLTKKLPGDNLFIVYYLSNVLSML